MKPFFKYFGGKWRDAPYYPQPHHDVIVEPFAGAAGYSVRYADRKVILCDLDPIICGVWKYLIGVKASEILSIPDVGDDETVDDLKVPQEAKWLVGFWLNSGVHFPCKRPSAWMRSKVRPGSHWGQRAKSVIASQVDKIRHWSVFNVSFDQCPWSGAATWFVDPPYQVQGRKYRFGSSRIDYPQLGQWCMSLKGQVMVCENVGADWLPFASFRSAKATISTRRSAEAIWTNVAPKQASTLEDLWTKRT